MQKEQFKKLQEIEAVFNHLPDGIITISAPKPLRITNINSVACKILNTKNRKILDEEIHRVFDLNFSPLLQVVQETLEQKRAIKNFTIEIKTGKGEIKTFLANTTLIRNDVGLISTIILILHDISEVSQLRYQSTNTQRFETLIGGTATMKKVFSLIETVAPTDAAVLIYGETGTGKELVARAIHERSYRSNGPFIPVHCSALTSSLLESDLFGHVKGAFTGAIKDRPGRFEMADGGTI
ncbi:MAG: sigma 54-interacting transcriptional regulator, partial [bacterium]